jgi:hypothetical protein
VTARYAIKSKKNMLNDTNYDFFLSVFIKEYINGKTISMARDTS